MDASSRRQKRKGGAVSSLNVAIDAMNLAKEVSSMTPAKAVFGSVSVLLTMIMESTANKADYVELGLVCVDVCRALERGVNGKKLDDLSQSVFEAIAQLTTTVAEIQAIVVEKGGRNLLSRLVHARNDKEAIAAWNLDLNRILLVFNTELGINTNIAVSDVRQGVLNTHAIVSELQHNVSDIHRAVVKSQEETEGKNQSAQVSIHPGESPPPPPRACFGRDELIEKIVGLVETFTPIALIGVGGIGKTSIALTVLHHDRIKERFGGDRRFIRCDQFPTSCANFLSRLSKVIGAGVENPEDLAPLRPFLSSKEMVIILDNAESVLDPQGTDAQEIYAVVEELGQFNNLCLCITSRISITPPDCEALTIPTLPMEAAHAAFYRIYKSDERSNLINDILEQLNFHPLSVTLLATVAYHNRWDNDRLTREWEQQRTSVLQTEHNKSLAATIELSLASPMFQELGPDARELLGVVAFFPQGVDENNLNWLFPTGNPPNLPIPEWKIIFDKFCVLSLTYRSNGFITMLAPLRDHLRPKDPASSPLLCTTKELYASRLSVPVDPGSPNFKQSRWIVSEDVNVEHLLDVFTAIDTNSDDIWYVCCCFMLHLYWHKPRLVVLGRKIEGLPDDHHAKPRALLQLSKLFVAIGNRVESKRLLVYTLKLWRERGDDVEVAHTLTVLSDANKPLGLHEEGIQQAKEALGIYERLDDKARQARSWQRLAWYFYGDQQLDAAEEAASRAINLLLDEDDQYVACGCHRLLGSIHKSKSEMEKAIDQFETALSIASSFDWHDEQFWVHHSLVEVFARQGRLSEAHAHVGHAKSHAIKLDDMYLLARAMVQQAKVWRKECRFEEAKSEASRAADVFEKHGAIPEMETSRGLVRDIERQ